jgi:arylsulfatase A-like enzyme
MASQPNVLVITTDQQRFDAAGDNSPGFLRTPHYDLLRRQGTEFTAAYGSSPKCVPSRTEIMTGKSVHARADDDENTGDTYPYNVEGRAGTLPTCMREAGYQTAAVGKMHFNPVRARHGFDEMILPHEYYEEKQRSGDGQQPMRHGLGQNEIHPGKSTVPESETLTSWITEECVDYLRRRRDPTVPFFLWCSFSKPHPPLDPPEPYYSMYQDADIPDPVTGDWSATDDLPAVVRHHPWVNRAPDPDPETVEAARAAYYGLITQVDYNVGRVLAALRETDLLADTLIIYTSDHGCYLGDHGLYNKMYFNESAARVPMVVRQPTSRDDRRAGATVADPVLLADILPTAVAAGGGTPPDGCDGRDLVALARGETAPREYVEGMSATVSDCDYLALTDGRWKYIWYPDGPHEHLFDLEADPLEERNLAGDPKYDERRRELREELVGRHRDTQFVEDGDLAQFEDGASIDDDFPDDPSEETWEGLVTDYFVEGDVRH